MTLEVLKAKGCNVDEGMARCMNNEEFYLKMIDMFFADETKFDALGKALDENNMDDAFEQAHALKGVCANLALTPLEKKLSDITELLRAKESASYGEMYKDIIECFGELKN